MWTTNIHTDIRGDGNMRRKKAAADHNIPTHLLKELGKVELLTKINLFKWRMMQRISGCDNNRSPKVK